MAKISLDGRTEKHQPGVCHVCHGGEPKPLVNGVYPDFGDTGASFMAWDPDLYKYSSQSPYTRTDQERKFWEFNQTVLTIRNVPHFDFDKSARAQLIEGWYKDTSAQTINFNGDYVPEGWIPESAGGHVGVPNGTDTLYLEVIKPTCRLCHLQRGVEGNAPINFTTYMQFIAFQKEIESTVYDAGTMPLALRTFNKFWQSRQGDILASHLSGFSHYDGNTTNVLKPGRPIANAGASPRVGNRIVEYAPTNPQPTPVTLNGSASLFAKNYNWILNESTNPPPMGSVNIQLGGANTATPTFVPDAAGDYTIILTVNDGTTASALISTSQITVTAIENPGTVSFSNDIVPKFDPTLGSYLVVGSTFGKCTGCHATFFDQFAKYGKYTKGDFVQRKVIDFTAPDLYSQLVNKINLNNPINSKIIAYPSTTKHTNGVMTGYGQLEDPTIPPNFEYYDLLLNWLLEGAQNN